MRVTVHISIAEAAKHTAEDMLPLAVKDFTVFGFRAPMGSEWLDRTAPRTRVFLSSINGRWVQTVPPKQVQHAIRVALEDMVYEASLHGWVYFSVE